MSNYVSLRRYLYRRKSATLYKPPISVVFFLRFFLPASCLFKFLYLRIQQFSLKAFCFSIKMRQTDPYDMAWRIPFELLHKVDAVISSICLPAS